MKTTEADFQRFKCECLRLQEKWGLLDYTLYFTHGTGDGNLAEITPDDVGCVARLRYAKTVSISDVPPVEILAKHEMIHLLLSRVKTLGSSRWAADDELENEIERLVVKLEKII